LPTQNIAPTLSLVFIQLQTRGSPLKPFSLHQPSNDDHRISNPSRKKSRAIIIFQTFTQSFPDRLYLYGGEGKVLSQATVVRMLQEGGLTEPTFIGVFFSPGRVSRVPSVDDVLLVISKFSVDEKAGARKNNISGIINRITFKTLFILTHILLISLKLKIPKNLSYFNETLFVLRRM